MIPHLLLLIQTFFLLLQHTLAIGCADSLMTSKQINCEEESLIKSTSASFPNSLSIAPGVSELTIDIVFSSVTMCLGSAPGSDIFVLTITPPSSPEIKLLSFNWESCNSAQHFCSRTRVYGTSNTAIIRASAANQATPSEFMASISFSYQVVHSSFRSPVLGTSSPEYLSEMVSAFDLSWKFDSTTKFYICSDMTGEVTASCMVENVAVWYSFWMDDGSGVRSSYGLKPSLYGFYPLNEMTGTTVSDAGLIGAAAFGSTAGVPFWATTGTGIEFTTPDQYLRIPYFAFAPSIPDLTVGSLSVSLWIRLANSNWGYIFRIGLPGWATSRLAVAVRTDRKLDVQVFGSSNQQTISSLPLTTWTLLTMSFVFRQVGQAHLASIYFGSQNVGTFQFFSTLQSFLMSDLFHFGGPSSFYGKLAKIRVFTPGSLVLFGPCPSYSTCEMQLGAASPPSCLTCGIGCQTCPADPGQTCSGCFDGRYLTASGCPTCPPVCLTCTDSQTCLTCQQGFDPQNGQCVCPSGSYQSGLTCVPYICSSNCLTCTASQTCDTCQPGFLLQNNQCVTCPSGTYLSGNECKAIENEPEPVVKPPAISNGTKEVLSAGGTATKAVTQIANVFTSGSPTGMSAAISGKIFSNIKFFNISYSDELEQALMTWKSNFISLGFNTDLPNFLEDHIIERPVPFMFEKREISSSFLLNFWQNISMIILISLIFLTFVGLSWIASKASRKYLPVSYLRIARTTTQNFLLTQLYGIFGDVVLFTFLEWRSINFSMGITGLSFTFSLAFLAIGITSLILHFKLLRKYQTVRKQSLTTKNDGLLTKFNQDHEGSQVLFREFKDSSFLQQSFLLIFTARDILISLLLVLLFGHPLIQTVFIIIFNILVLGFILWRNPYRSLFDAGQQVFYELVSLLVNLQILMMGILDSMSSPAVSMRKDIGKVIIAVNIGFNFATFVFIVVKLAIEAKEAIQNYRNKRKEKIKTTPTPLKNENLSPSLSPIKFTPSNNTSVSYLNQSSNDSMDVKVEDMNISSEKIKLNRGRSSQLNDSTGNTARNSATSDVNTQLTSDTSPLRKEAKPLNIQKQTFRVLKQSLQDSENLQSPTLILPSSGAENFQMNYRPRSLVVDSQLIKRIGVGTILNKLQKAKESQNKQ